MKEKDKHEILRQSLIDAQDGNLEPEARKKLLKKVEKEAPGLLESHSWMIEQLDKGGFLNEIATLRKEEPGRRALIGFYSRQEKEKQYDAQLEYLVRSWFKRYVLTIGILLILVIGWIYPITQNSSDIGGREEIEYFLGWDAEPFPELDHWLYDDLF